MDGFRETRHGKLVGAPRHVDDDQAASLDGTFAHILAMPRPHRLGRPWLLHAHESPEIASMSESVAR